MSTDTITDEKTLIRQLKKGDLYAYDTLYRKYSTKLLYFTLGYVKIMEDAEEIVQEVFLILWRNHKQLDENLSFNSYLFTVTYNAIRKSFRRQGREKKYLDNYLLDFDEKDLNTLTQIEYKDLIKEVRDIVETFPERRKEIFRLSREQHLNNQEIAERLNISKKTVENNITEALRILREKMNVVSFFLLCMYLF
jgi:RNA polymerase sigma-70 factor (ECF subfamily)